MLRSLRWNVINIAVNITLNHGYQPDDLIDLNVIINPDINVLLPKWPITNAQSVFLKLLAQIY